jgi:hypothetical protein
MATKAGEVKLRKAVNQLPAGTHKRLLEETGMPTLAELAVEWDVTGRDKIADLVRSIRLCFAESDVMAYHVQWAEDEFGKDVQINLGWAIDDGMVQSKIYGHGVLTTWHNEHGIYDEQFEEF